MATGNATHIEHELGDVLFSVVNYARKLGVDPENALRGTVERFSQRFRHMEKGLEAEGKGVRGTGMDELDSRWDIAKAALK